MTADTLDLITLADVKLEIRGLGNDGDDTLLQAYVTAASRAIDNLCGPVVRRTLTAEVYDLPGAHGYAGFQSSPVVGSEDKIRLRTYPVSSVTTVTEYQPNGSSTVLTADTLGTKQASGFWFNSTEKWARTVCRRSGGSPFPFPAGGQVAVTYVAGRYATTATVDSLFVQAAKLTVSTWWGIQQGTGSMTFGPLDGGGAPIPISLPKAVVALLASETLPMGAT